MDAQTQEGCPASRKVTCRSMAGMARKSAASRRFVAPSAERLAKWMASDLIQSRPADYAE